MPPLIVRAPNHLGDVVMALPALRAASGPARDATNAEGAADVAGAGGRGAHEPADILVVRGLVPILEMAGLPGRILPFDRGAAGLVRAAGALRRGPYRRGILLTPSFSSALVFLLGGVRERRGTATDGRSMLLTERIPRARIDALHRAAAYLLLAGDEAAAEPPAPRLPVPQAERARWRSFVGGSSSGGPTIGIFPGSNAASRRWDTGRYRALAARLAADGARVVVFGGPGERRLTAEVAGDVAFDAGGRTDLRQLAAGLAECALLVTNDSGPMHLAAAVGTRTVSLQGASDPAVTRPLGAAHVLLQHAELSCVPCVRNVCPRRGAGTFLPEAERECLRLITVDEVHGAVVRSVDAAVPD